MIRIENISFAYGEKQILKDVSFDLEKGQCLAVLGNNGVGKSTLITCLNRILPAKRGLVYIDDKNVWEMKGNELARHIGYVAQKNELSYLTVFDCVLMGRKPYMKWGMTDEDLRICDDMLERMGLAKFRLCYISELSGGELQKVMLARALVQEPQLLLLEEPTSNLDPKHQHEMLKLVGTLAKERNFGVILIIHDLALALRYADKFLLMKDGSVYDCGDISVITPKALADVYNIDAQIEKVCGYYVPIIHE